MEDHQIPNENLDKPWEILELPQLSYLYYEKRQDLKLNCLSYFHTIIEAYIIYIYTYM